MQQEQVQIVYYLEKRWNCPLDSTFWSQLMLTRLSWFNGSAREIST